MAQFDPPGFLDDFDDPQRAAWSDWISQTIDASAAGEPEAFDFDAPRPRFFNHLANPPSADATEKDITWTAFPRIVQLDSATEEERWTTADASRDAQDEYCEWSVSRLPDGRIRRVTFTCEGPEYWEFLAATNAQKVLALYRTHVNSAVAASDLLDSNGGYNPRNKWNNSTRNGAMHLIQPNNTLSAEIELAAAASNARKRNGVLLTSPRDLILCGRYGQAERHSDPTIGAEVNALARADADITLANPVGIYLGALSTAGWQTPDGSNPATFWKITRGTAQKAVRAVYEVPDDRGFPVGDITINGLPIRFGAQIADFITIKLTGLATRLGQSLHAPLAGCKRRATSPIAELATLDVAALIARGNRSMR